MANHHISVDDARLRPHLRPNQPVPFIPPDNGVKHIPTLQLGPPRARTNDGLMVDPQELRGIPIVGKGVTGVSPQTQPETETIRRITRQEHAA